MANPPGWDAVHKYKMHGNPKIRLVFFWAKNCVNNPAPAYAAKAVSIFGNYGVGVDVYPASVAGRFAQVPEMTLDYDDQAFDLDDVRTLRAQANGKFNDQDPSAPGGGKLKRLPVIFCQFRDKLKDDDDSQATFGSTPNKLDTWPPFVLINSERQSVDSATLAHEIGHAAGLGHTAFNGYVMNYPPPDRSEFLQPEMRKIVESYFCKLG
jgi:hypothetical protein